MISHKIGNTLVHFIAKSVDLGTLLVLRDHLLCFCKLLGYDILRFDEVRTFFFIQ